MIAPGFVQDALDCLRAQCIDAAPILAAAGLPADPAEPVTTEDYGRLWRAMATAQRDEFFGLGARPMRPGSFALMCSAALPAPTLESALRRALLFLNVVLDDPTGALEVCDGQAVVRLTDRTGPRTAFAYRTYWLILMGLACWLVGRRIPLHRVDFACPAPPHRRDVRQFFGAPVHFDEPQSRLAFDARYLALTPRRTDAALRAFLRGAPANILVRYRHDQGMTARVRSALRARAPAQWPGFAALALAMEVSPATLRRRLRAEGQSFAAIKDEIRAARAQAALAAGGLSVAEIAADLGYSEPSAFHRAYRKWTGTTPAAARAAGGG